MAADIYEQDILVARHPDASSMGAAALALFAAGELENINDFKAEYDSAEKVFCDEAHFAYYRRQYERYREAYEEVRL